MNKIPSFTINHERLLRGIYVSRNNQVDGEVKSDVSGVVRQ